MQYADMIFAFAQEQHRLARLEAERRGQIRPLRSNPRPDRTRATSMWTARVDATREFAARLRQRTAATA